MRFERTHDMETVRWIMTEPSIYRFIVDDGCPPSSEFRPFNHPSVWYVLVFDGQTPLGLWMLTPHNSCCFEVHTCLLPVARGQRSRVAAGEFLDWVWKSTPCERLVTSVPAFNKLALKFAKEAGMVEYGINPQSFKRHARLFDQHLLGMSRPSLAEERAA